MSKHRCISTQIVLVAILTIQLMLAGCAVKQPAAPAPPAHLSWSATRVMTKLVPPPAPIPLPNSDVLAAMLKKVSTKGIGATGVVVADIEGNVLYSNGDKVLSPASTTKILTAMVAVDLLGTDTTFETRVVQVADGTIALVGGGDPFLTTTSSKNAYAPASLAKLAEQTAKALGGKKSVKLVYDMSLFSGPGWGNNWRDSWKKTYPRVGALTVDGGKITQWKAATDPAAAAAEAFAKQLKKVKVTVTSTKAGPAPKDGKVLASVKSAPVSVIVEQLLRYSNNLAAEVLARHAGLANSGEGSFAGGSAAIRSWLEKNGLWVDKTVIDGGSGLSLTARLSPGVLAGTLAQAFSDERYAPVLAGLPIAGKDGTLKKRFNDKEEAAGRNVVHAKTGSLNNVTTLAGYLTDADGVTLVFAAMANQVSGADTKGQDWLDRTAAVLVTCGCRES